MSWLIPVRDLPTAGRAVASALADSGPDDEVVVVDDGSRVPVGPGLPADPRIRVLRTPPRGIARALEAGRRRCRGRYIARLDADDEVLPGRLAAQLRALEADPSLAAVGGRARLWRAGGPVPEGMRRYVEAVAGVQDPMPRLLVECPLLHPAATLRADALSEIGGWRDGDFPEDYDLWLRLARAGWRLANLPRDVIRMEDRPDRLTRTDPRYRREAFRRLKARHLEAILPPGQRIAIWCGRKGGRPWIRWVHQAGHRLVAVIDLRPGGVRGGAPVLPPEAVGQVAFDRLLVAVGTRGATDTIRAALARLRPELVEGRDWWALA